jgi:uncharacterized membrane protein
MNEFSFKRPTKKARFGFPLKVASTSVLALLLNSFVFALVYFIADRMNDDDKSRIKGIQDKNNFWNYVYFSIVIGSTLGLGDMIPNSGDTSRRTSVEMRVIIALHVLASLFLVKFVDSTENFILSME